MKPYTGSFKAAAASVEGVARVLCVAETLHDTLPVVPVGVAEVSVVMPLSAAIDAVEPLSVDVGAEPSLVAAEPSPVVVAADPSSVAVAVSDALLELPFVALGADAFADVVIALGKSVELSLERALLPGHH